MIQYLEASTPTCFVVKFSGKLRGVEYRELITKAESAIRTQGTVNLVLVMQELDFPEWDAIKADTHFGLKDYRHVRRAAYVGDQTWVEWFVKLIGPFTRTAERMFRPDQLNEAVQWASEQTQTP
jgi:hypothetical protein